MGWIMLLAGLALLALPCIHWVKPEWGEPPVDLSPGSAELQAGKRVCIGGIAHEHESAVPSPLTPEDRVLWCHAIVAKHVGVNIGGGPPATRTLKAATWFRLVDADRPECHVLINGHQLSASMVALDHEPERVVAEQINAQPGAQANPLMELFELIGDIFASISRAHIKTIRPGDRIWVSGRLRDSEHGLHLGRWAMVDNVHPGERHQRNLVNARLVGSASGFLLIVLGLWQILT